MAAVPCSAYAFSASVAERPLASLRLPSASSPAIVSASGPPTLRVSYASSWASLRPAPGPPSPSALAPPKEWLFSPVSPRRSPRLPPQVGIPGVCLSALSSLTFSSLVEQEAAQMQQIRRLCLEQDHGDSSCHLTVADCMTQGQLIVAKQVTPIYEALEALVEHRITGMPVVDEEEKVVGVVSDYDLLALDSISGSIAASSPEAARAAAASAASDLFPEPNTSWRAFREIQKLLSKTQGRTVGDVMTANPLTVRPMSNLEDAARLLLDSRFRRLPVVDEEGTLVGILTRGNVIRAALMLRRAAEGKGLAPSGGN